MHNGNFTKTQSCTFAGAVYILILRTKPSTRVTASMVLDIQKHTYQLESTQVNKDTEVASTTIFLLQLYEHISSICLKYKFLVSPSSIFPLPQLHFHKFLYHFCNITRVPRLIIQVRPYCLCYTLESPTILDLLAES
jgi:hypothetical protein